MPVNIATIIGLVISFTHWEMPEVIHIPVQMLSQVAIPLMLVSLGVRMTTVDLSAWRLGFIGAILCPLFSVLVAFFLLFIHDELFNHGKLFFHANRSSTACPITDVCDFASSSFKLHVC